MTPCGWFVGICAACSALACGTPPLRVRQLIQDIKTDEVRVQAEQQGQEIELVGFLTEKHVEEREKIKLQETSTSQYSAEGRMVSENVVVARIADAGGVAECEVGEYYTRRIAEIPIDTWVIARGTLRRWKTQGDRIIPVLDQCRISEAD